MEQTLARACHSLPSVYHGGDDINLNTADNVNLNTTDNVNLNTEDNINVNMDNIHRHIHLQKYV